MKSFSYLLIFLFLATGSLAQNVNLQVDKDTGVVWRPSNFISGNNLATETVVDGWFADPSSNGSFSASAWRTDLDLYTTSAVDSAISAATTAERTATATLTNKDLSSATNTFPDTLATAVAADPDLRDFLQVLATTDSRLANGQLAYLANIVSYLKAHALWADAAIIPFQRGTVAVSNGGGLPCLGGWFSSATTGTKAGTTTLTGSGIMLNGSNEGVAVTLPDLHSQGIVTIMQRMALPYASTPDATGIQPTYWTIGDTGVSQVIALGLTSGNISGETILITYKDTVINGRLGTNDVTWSAHTPFTLTTELGPAGTRMWQGTTPATLDLTSGMSATTETSPNSTGYTTDDAFRIGYLRSSGANSNFMEGSVEIFLVFKRQLSGPDRAALVTLLDAVNNPAPAFIWWGDSLTEANHTTGWADAGNTRRLTPPTRHLSALINAVQINRGASGETAAQIAARFVDRWENTPTIVWAGTNDKDDADEVGVVDDIATIINALTTTRYIVVTPLVKSSWDSTQKANIAAIRAEIISRYPNNYLDAWAVANTTAGTPDTGYLRWQSVNTEDDLHPNDDWYADFVSDLNTFITAKGWDE